jgi:hypothetical protein
VNFPFLIQGIAKLQIYPASEAAPPATGRCYSAVHSLAL